jgi:hypothetical protein
MNGLLAAWPPESGVEALGINIPVQEQTNLIFGGFLGRWRLPAGWGRI